MKSREFCVIARRLMEHPAVPYHEHGVRGEVERICAENGLSCRRDRFGNLLVHWKNSRGMRAFVLAAHMDHPGFEILRQRGGTRLQARFLGGVPDGYFRRGTLLQAHPGATPASLGRKRGEEYNIELKRPCEVTPQFAVWDLPAVVTRNGRIHGRACDDLIGVASALATLIELKRTRARVNAVAVISRAEEVGFHGALAVAASGELPRRAFVVSLETSRELPGVRMGGGVILRVGDRTSIFDSDGTRFLQEVAKGLTAADDRFQFQRGLMSGGTCEATAYQEFEYQTAAVCVALGNYHNCGPRNRIRAEYVDVADVLSMVRLLVASANRMKDYDRLTSELPRRLRRMLTSARRRLAESPSRKMRKI